jgi:hypothetical protein
MRAIRHLLAAFFLALPAPAGGALAADLTPCQCFDCLKLVQLEAQAVRQAFEDRWPTAQKELQKEIDRYNNDPAYRATFDGEQRILFCSLWSTLEDELNVVRDLETPKIQKQVYADRKECAPKVPGATNPATCQINQELLLASEVLAPCPQMHLSVLAHELVHAEDCEWDRRNTDWLRDSPKGENCWKAYSGKTTPTPEQLMQFAHQNFVTEEHAHRIESQVEKLLRNELAKQCKPEDYSTKMASNFREASKFLKRAREYKIVLPP